MKKTNFLITIAMSIGLVLVSCNRQKSTKETTDEAVKLKDIEINLEESAVKWKGIMLGVYSHEGTLKLTQAELIVDKGKLIGGSFTVDMKSITPTDKNYDIEKGNTPERLVGHLSAADFFDISNHQTAKFEIKKMEGNSATGILTIRGISGEEKVENITVSKAEEKVKITGDLVFNRKKYNVSWDSPAKDMVLSEDVEVKVELVSI